MVNHSGFYWSKRWWGGSGISCTICKSFARSSRQIITLIPHHLVFTGRMPFLPLNQQCQSTEELKTAFDRLTLEMWANAQRDGRPAEYRWRPLFNAAKFGWRPLLQCRAVTLPRCETCWNSRGAPNYRTVSAASGSKFTILWGHVEEILLLNKLW